MTTITRTALSKVLGISITAIKSWESTRDFGTCYEGDKISLEKTCRWLYEWKVELDEQKTEEESPKSVKAFWDGKKSEATYKTMVQELVSKAEYIQTEIERMSIIKQAIMDIPDKLAVDLALSPEQQNLVKQTCKSTLERAKSTFKGRTKDWLEIINSKSLRIENDSPE